MLLLDEPSAGLSPRYVLEIFEHIVAVNKAGVAILMVEQNARQALAFASKGFVLAQGQNRFTGTGAELIADPVITQATFEVEVEAGAGAMSLSVLGRAAPLFADPVDYTTFSVLRLLRRRQAAVMI